MRFASSFGPAAEVFLDTVLLVTYCFGCLFSFKNIHDSQPFPKDLTLEVTLFVASGPLPKVVMNLFASGLWFYAYNEWPWLWRAMEVSTCGSPQQPVDGSSHETLLRSTAIGAAGVEKRPILIVLV